MTARLLEANLNSLSDRFHLLQENFDLDHRKLLDLDLQVNEIRATQQNTAPQIASSSSSSSSSSTAAFFEPLSLPSWAHLNDAALIHACDRLAQTLPGFVAGYPAFLQTVLNGQLCVGLWAFSPSICRRTPLPLPPTHHATCAGLVYASPEATFASHRNAFQTAESHDALFFGGFPASSDSHVHFAQSRVEKHALPPALNGPSLCHSVSSYLSAFRERFPSTDPDSHCLIPSGSSEAPSCLRIVAGEDACFRWVPIRSLHALEVDLAADFSATPPLCFARFPPLDATTQRQPLRIHRTRDGPIVPSHLCLSAGTVLRPFCAVVSQNARYSLVFDPNDIALKLYSHHDTSQSALVWQTRPLFSFLSEASRPPWYLLGVQLCQNGALLLVHLDTGRPIHELPCFRHSATPAFPADSAPQLSVSNAGLVQLRSTRAHCQAVEFPVLPALHSLSHTLAASDADFVLLLSPISALQEHDLKVMANAVFDSPNLQFGEAHKSVQAVPSHWRQSGRPVSILHCPPFNATTANHAFFFNLLRLCAHFPSHRIGLVLMLIPYATQLHQGDFALIQRLLGPVVWERHTRVLVTQCPDPSSISMEKLKVPLERNGYLGPRYFLTHQLNSDQLELDFLQQESPSADPLCLVEAAASNIDPTSTPMFLTQDGMGPPVLSHVFNEMSQSHPNFTFKSDDISNQCSIC